MKTSILIVTKDTVHQEVLDAAYAQGCGDVLVNILPPIPLSPDPEENRHKNCTRNRNEMRKKALQTDADAFLWVDSDVILPDGAVKKFEDSGLDVAGGWYAMHDGLAYVAGIMLDPKILSHYRSPKKHHTPVDLMGLGCCFMKREVLEKFEFFASDEILQSPTGRPCMAGECFDFTQKVKAYNPMMIDVVCDHIPPDPKYYAVEASLLESITKYLSNIPALQPQQFVHALSQLKKE